MSVASWVEKFDCDFTVDMYMSRKYKRVFQATTTSFDDGPLTLLAYGFMPARFSYYQFNTSGFDVDMGAVLTDVNIVRPNPTTSPNEWLITCNYSSLYIDPEKGAENPLSRPSIVSYSFANFTKPILMEVAGENAGVAIKNTAKQPYDPPIEIDNARLVMRIEKNVTSFPTATAVIYMNAINSDIWMGGAQYTWRCTNIGGDEQFENGFGYYRCVLEFQFDYETWLKKVPSRGYNELVFVSDEGVNDWAICKDKDGQTLSIPAFLDENGLQFTAADLESGASPYEQTFHVFYEQPFGALGLP